MKNIKWFVVIGVLLAVLIIALVIGLNTISPIAEPNEFSLRSSTLVQDYWDDDFIGSIKLIIESEDIYINGTLTRFDTRGLVPVIYNDHVFLPIGLIADLVMASVKYDNNRNAIIEAGEIIVEVFIEQNTIIANGKEETLEPAAFILNDRVMVSMGIMNFFGFDEPIWDAESNEIVLVKAYQTHRLIVVTNGGELRETHGATHIIEGENNVYVLQYASEQAAKEADRLFNDDPDVLFSQPDTVIHTESATTQTTTEVLSWGTVRVGADYYTKQLINRSSKNTVVVAVLDSGIYFDHPFLANRISSVRWCFVSGNNNPYDVHGHGTHVSGIVVDSTPPNVMIMPLKVLGDDGLGTTLNIYNAIIYAADSGADVINMSLGRHLGRDSKCELYEKAIDYAISKNVIVITSAGNDNGDAGHYAPAYYSGIITVAATDENDMRASFSNFGNSVDIAAPGVGINSPIPGGDFALYDGTSMAAPFVAACAALLRSTNHSLSQTDVLAILSDNADNVGSSKYFGAGIVNVVGLVPESVGVSVTGVSLNQRSLSLVVGRTEQLTATVAPHNASNPEVAWSSDNQDVATVSRDGVVTAVSPGNALVIARTIDGNFVSRCEVTVTTVDVPVAGVSLNKTNLLLVTGETERLTANIIPALATNQNVTWNSDNNDIATVSQDGLVVAAKPGNAVITATTSDGSFRAVCAVTVLNDVEPITGLSLNKNSLSISVGDSETLLVTVTPSYATNPRVIWRSDNRGVATVSQEGEVIAIGPGSTVITVHTFDERISSICHVTVNP